MTIFRIIFFAVCIWSPIVADSWLDFFNNWSEFNTRNRRALFGTQETTRSAELTETPAAHNPDHPATPILRLHEIKGSVPQGIYDLRAYLLDKEAFTKAGALPPHGILLVGPPGTGKTTLVRALAAEVNVPLIATSASQFVEIYVGTGPKFIRELFQKAHEQMKERKASHAIIFIDEIDSIGSRTNHHASPEDHKTVNELLTQMDGYAKDTSITVIAATNCLDLVDEALLRPGRFDEIITVGLPDYKDRLEILKLYLYSAQFKRSIDPEMELESIALNTQGFSGAELESIVNKAALIIAREKRTIITQDDLDQAFEQVKAMQTKRRRS